MAHRRRAPTPVSRKQIFPPRRLVLHINNAVLKPLKPNIMPVSLYAIAGQRMDQE